MAIGTIALAVFTAVYVLLTFRLLKATKQAYEAQTEAQVIAYLGDVHDPSYMKRTLVVENIGKSFASDVVVEPDAETASWLFKDVEWGPDFIWPIRIPWIAPGERNYMRASEVKITPQEWENRKARLNITYRTLKRKRLVKDSAALGWCGRSIMLSQVPIQRVELVHSDWGSKLENITRELRDIKHGLRSHRS